ncbi:hypothetical protein OG785_38550 [Streptomyces sp. NBC_00006]|uniref:hypothetical protein n=1 Tax=Streptomyces sp. NBC_00006 TaxID=2975619 RepID=UPI002253A41D|nr:hypothetical protein [Streptomyces sp. NBC_00006]MCX5536450.1 hypothetical protein [Streptomyces sp. NBC_00006]
MHTDPHMYLFLYHTRACELRAQADTHRLPRTTGRPSRGLRTRVGWTLVEVGLKLAAPARSASATP